MREKVKSVTAGFLAVIIAMSIPVNLKTADASEYSVFFGQTKEEKKGQLRIPVTEPEMTEDFQIISDGAVIERQESTSEIDSESISEESQEPTSEIESEDISEESQESVSEIESESISEESQESISEIDSEEYSGDLETNMITEDTSPAKKSHYTIWLENTTIVPEITDDGDLITERIWTVTQIRSLGFGCWKEIWTTRSDPKRSMAAHLPVRYRRIHYRTLTVR